jgi:hypothetical protein
LVHLLLHPAVAVVVLFRSAIYQTIIMVNRESVAVLVVAVVVVQLEGMDLAVLVFLVLEMLVAMAVEPVKVAVVGEVEDLLAVMLQVTLVEPVVLG